MFKTQNSISNNTMIQCWVRRLTGTGIEECLYRYWHQEVVRKILSEKLCRAALICTKSVFNHILHSSTKIYLNNFPLLFFFPRTRRYLQTQMKGTAPAKIMSEKISVYTCLHSMLLKQQASSSAFFPRNLKA